MKLIKINSHIKNGKPIQNRGMIQKGFESFEGYNITVTIERKKEKRSTSANAYYWGVVIKMIKLAIEEQTGDVTTSNDVHDMLRGQFNTREIRISKSSSDRLINQPQSTATLTTWAFAKYVEHCRFWANDFFNIEIPEPGEDISGKIDDDFEEFDKLG